MKKIANKRALGAICMLVSAFFFAFVGVGIKLAGDEVGVWQVSFYRAVVGIILMLTMAAGFKVSLAGHNLKLLFIRGLSGTLGFLALTVALRMIPLAEVMVLFYLFPAFAAMLSPWLNKEKVSGRDWLFIAVAFAGTVVVISPGEGTHLQWGHLVALFVAVSAGFNTSLVRRLSGEHSPYAIYLFFCLSAAMVSIWPLVAGHEPLLPTGLGALYLGGIGLVATIGQVLMNQGFYYLPATEGGVVLMSQVIIAATWGAVFFGEPLTWRLLVGGSLILGGGAALNREGRKRFALAQSEKASSQTAGGGPGH